eukprot:SAG31_NODE_1611_length_7748_cov_2.128758_7_plen_130_part_00
MVQEDVAPENVDHFRENLWRGQQVMDSRRGPGAVSWREDWLPQLLGWMAAFPNLLFAQPMHLMEQTLVLGSRKGVFDDDEAYAARQQPLLSSRGNRSLVLPIGHHTWRADRAKSRGGGRGTMLVEMGKK